MLTPAIDGSGYELRLIKIRPTANGLLLRCNLRESRGKIDHPKDQATGDLIDVVVESDPDKPEPVVGKLDDIVPSMWFLSRNCC